MKHMKAIRGFLKAVNQEMRLGKVRLNEQDSDFLSFETIQRGKIDGDGYCYIIGLNHSNKYYELIRKLATKWFTIPAAFEVGFNNTGSHFWFYIEK